jgi:hypothetical protein
VYGAPAVTSVAPTGGGIAGATAVTITGTGFVTGATVHFGGASYPATSVVVVSGTSITCNSPAHPLGKVDVTVTTPGGVSSTAGTANDFYYYGVPTITAVSPVTGPTAGGQTVTITGTNFGTILANVSVKFGTTPGVVTAVTDTSITVTTPAHSGGVVNVVVTTPGGIATKADGYTYGALAITSIVPDVGPTGGGQAVTINGTNFGAVANTTVTFGGSPGTVTAVTSTAITVTTPARSAGVVDVVVTTAGGTVTKNDGYTYGSPVITGVLPNEGPIAGGQTVTITGTRFGTSGAITVTFGGTAAAVNSRTLTSLVVTTPAHAASIVDVVVTTLGGSDTEANAYTYSAVGAPTITSVSPNAGPATGGQIVTIEGTSFSDNKANVSVTFGGSAGTVTASTTTSITVVTPAHATGVVSVVVTAPGGSVSLAGGYTYLAAPTISTVLPNAGPIAGGQVVTITGTNFGTVKADVTVAFGGSAATVDAVTDTAITVTTGPRAAGVVNVVVTAKGGTATKTNAYTYSTADPPTISNISPSAGPTGGNQTVTITGTNYGTAANTAVTFDSIPGNVTNVTPNTITVTTPAHAAGGVTVLVSAPGGTVSTSYTYLAAPTITGVSPALGKTAGGTFVTISGTNFGTVLASVTVKFGASSGTVTNVTDNTITVTTPAHGAGVVDVVVTAPGGTFTLDDGYTYMGTPTIVTIVPNTGPAGVGTNVTISGTNFGTGMTVTFGGEAATNVVVVNSTTITCTTPLLPAGYVEVVVTAEWGSASQENGFRYLD